MSDHLDNKTTDWTSLFFLLYVLGMVLSLTGLLVGIIGSLWADGAGASPASWHAHSLMILGVSTPGLVVALLAIACGAVATWREN